MWQRITMKTPLNEAFTWCERERTNACPWHSFLHYFELARIDA
jgi:hypothetical protein